MSLLPYASLTHRRKAYRAGDVVLILSQTATGDASLSFTSGIDSTYGEYIFKFYNISPATDNTYLQFQVNATDDDGGDYDVSLITSTQFWASHHEDDDPAEMGYETNQDKAQAATFQGLSYGGANADENMAGELHLFNPASTTYVKHFYGHANSTNGSTGAYSQHTAGYINDTTAIDDIRFKMAGGAFDGTIKMWGVK